MPTGKKQASGRGVNLVNRLKHPPPLDVVRRALNDKTPYTGLLEAPSTRAHGRDRSLQFLQRKIKHVMINLVDIATRTDETANTSIAQAAALTRSAYEDVMEERRHHLAGR